MKERSCIVKNEIRPEPSIPLRAISNNGWCCWLCTISRFQ